MATTYGLTDAGFIIKTLSIIRSDLESAVRAALGQSLALGDRTLLGQILGILAEQYAILWALAQAVYSSQDPNSATGISLDSVSALTGTIRPPASYSTVTLTLTGTATTLVPGGTIGATASTAQQFQTTQDSTLVAVSAWAATTAYVVGDRRKNGGNVYQCITSGVSAGSGGPTTTASDITDNTVHWRYLGAGAAASDIPARATVTGAIVAVSGDLTVIVTPVAGLSNIINLLDATPGRDVASDQELRLLREAELSGDGVSTQAAISAALLKVTGVTSVTVFHNDTDTTDANGVPPHAVEALVLGGADIDIATVLFEEVAAGIATYGTATPVTVTDSQGVDHSIHFSRPEQKLIYVDITVTYDATLYPSDGDAEIQLAIAEFGLTFKTGRDVTASGVGAQAFQVDGILDVIPVYIGLSPSPATSTTIPISTRQLAIFDTSRITVHSSAATP